MIGAAVALAAGLVCAALLLVLGRPGRGPPPASEAGLVVGTGPRSDRSSSAETRLRCYVGGRLVGELTLEACLRRKGVASGGLEDGMEPYPLSPDLLNAEAARNDPVAVEVLPSPETATPKTGTSTGASLAACWRHNGTEWLRLPVDLSQAACVQALFAGRCERAGEAAYGRWGAQTLRLVSGRVEISPDNRSFRLLLEQGPDCSLPTPG